MKDALDVLFSNDAKRYGRKIMVDDYLEYLDNLTSRGELNKLTLIMLKNKIQSATVMARESGKPHSFHIKDLRGKITGAIRCLPDGSIDVGKKEVS